MLALTAAAVLVALPASPGVGEPLAAWFDSLPLPGLRDVSVEQALVAIAGAAFLLGTANRIVRLVLGVAGAPALEGEETLKGGRWLGPLERIFLLALALAGDLTAAAIVIAAKGVLRLPEIRTARDEKKGSSDVVTEYFLVGTFVSWLLAVGVAGFISLAA